jgi:hypothetical protein
MSNEATGAGRGTFLTAHAYIQISHMDGSFSEVGVNLKPAAGLDDVEDALAECRTAREVLACLLHFAQDGSAPVGDDSPSHADQGSLSAEEMDRSSRLLREALGEQGANRTDPVA